jgi:hypothetical protein
MTITGGTKLLGLIADPVVQACSPAMANALLHAPLVGEAVEMIVAAVVQGGVLVQVLLPDRHEVEAPCWS